MNPINIHNPYSLPASNYIDENKIPILNESHEEGWTVVAYKTSKVKATSTLSKSSPKNELNSFMNQTKKHEEKKISVPASVVKSESSSKSKVSTPIKTVSSKPIPNKVQPKKKVKEMTWRDELLAEFSKKFDGTLTTKMRTLLEDNGFIIVRATGAHMKVKFGAKCCSLSTSPSDGNAGRQAARQLLKISDQ